jgi:hypothetical protein
MAVSTTPTREKRRNGAGNARKRKSRKSPGWLAEWWPLLLGIAVTPIAVHVASIMALAGSDALGTLYPWIPLLKKPALRLGSSTMSENLSQVLMYIQFPIYGLLMAVILRSKSVWFALGVPTIVHSLAVLAVFLIAAS